MESFWLPSFLGKYLGSSTKMMPLYFRFTNVENNTNPTFFQVSKLPPNLGVLVVPLLVFLVSTVPVLTVLAKLLSETCVVVVVCSPLPRPGESGTSRPT
jgi:hypothetical protein